MAVQVAAPAAESMDPLALSAIQRAPPLWHVGFRKGSGDLVLES